MGIGIIKVSIPLLYDYLLLPEEYTCLGINQDVTDCLNQVFTIAVSHPTIPEVQSENHECPIIHPIVGLVNGTPTLLKVEIEMPETVEPLVQEHDDGTI